MRNINEMVIFDEKSLQELGAVLLNLLLQDRILSLWSMVDLLNRYQNNSSVSKDRYCAIERAIAILKCFT